jgi:hypothetical protein
MKSSGSGLENRLTTVGSLWPTISRPACLGVRLPFGAHDLILLFSSWYENFLILKQGTLSDERAGVTCIAVNL